MPPSKRTSILARSKRVENRVARYIWGPEALRDWKDTQDVSGLDAHLNLWVGEVKSYKWPAGPVRLWTILHDALLQAEGNLSGVEHPDKASGAPMGFAVLVPKGCETKDALVMFRREADPIVTTLQWFRDSLLGLAPTKEDEDRCGG